MSAPNGEMPKICDLYELLYVAAFGWNQSCKRVIRTVLRDHKTAGQLFLFHEYFLSEPLPRGFSVNDTKRAFVHMPFAPRIIEHGLTAPVLNQQGNDIDVALRNSHNFENVKYIFPLEDSQNTKSAAELWSNLGWAKAPESQEKGDISKWVNVSDKQSGPENWVGFMNKWDLEWQKKYGTVDPKKPTLAGLSKKAVYRLFASAFAGISDEENVPGLFIPLASSRLFYGAIWVMLPGNALKEMEPNDQTRRALARGIIELAEVTYLPGLAFLHEHWLEQLQADVKPLKFQETFSLALPPYIQALDNPQPGAGAAANSTPGTGKKPPAECRNAFANLQKLVNTREDSPRIVDSIESLLRKLWLQRQPGKVWGDDDSLLRDSLIFTRYMVCSESMIKLVARVIDAAATLRRSHDTLPACIVVGGAGSGKEKLARMLRLFSDEYHAGKDYTLNMAAIRPAPLTAAVVSGVQFGHLCLKFKGVLQRIREGNNKKEKPCFPTLRLDEFNSMDADSQGVLLRLLDNSEMIPLGGLEDPDRESTNLLVVGIMNEDPQEISKEESMEFLRKNRFLGQFVGDMLYEHLMRLRRLRPDVMYRMMRNGKFIIPPLRERREDICLLMHMYVAEELKLGNSALDADGHEIKMPPVHLTLPVLAKLLSSEFQWPGNVRELQALAKAVAELVRPRAEKTEPGYPVVVTEMDLQEALDRTSIECKPE